MAPDGRPRGQDRLKRERDSSRDKSYRDGDHRDDRERKENRNRSRSPLRSRDSKDWGKEPHRMDRKPGHTVLTSRSPVLRPNSPLRSKEERSMGDGRVQNGEHLPGPPPLPPQPFGNRMLQHLKEEAKRALASKARAAQITERVEENGLNASDLSKRNRHSPIVWKTPPKKQAVGPESPTHVVRTGSNSALSRAEQEILDFKARMQQQQLGYDPAAPAAVKSSPSVSEASADGSDGEEEGRYPQSPNGRSKVTPQHTPPSSTKKRTAAQLQHDGDEEEEEQEEEEEDVPSRPGLSSRWMDVDALDDDEAIPEPSQPKRQKTADPQPAEGSEDGERVEEASLRVGPSIQEGMSIRSPASIAVTHPAEGTNLMTGADGESASDSDDDEGMTNAAMMIECRSVEEYERLNKISEGTYGVVYRAREKASSKIYALKKIKMEMERDGFPQTSIREINILLALNHENIVNVTEVVVGRSLDSVFMVMEFVEHDLRFLMENEMQHPFSQAQVKCLMLQLLSGVAYLHENWVLHRDLKTSNLLYSNKGELKICDFGLARQYGSPLKQFTQRVVTLWYRAPELLMGQVLYDTKLDMWSVGCIMAELLSKKPLFAGTQEIEQIDKIFRIMGTPSEETWPGWGKLPGPGPAKAPRPVFKEYPNVLREKFPKAAITGPVLSDEGFDLLSQLLAYDPERRISAVDAMQHPWFTERPLPQPLELMPTFRSRKEGSSSRMASRK